MARAIALGGVARQVERPARCIACLAFVALMGAGLWAGVIWLAESILRSAPL